MIYFIRSGDAVKIGFATKPDSRIATLRTANPNNIVCLGVMDGGAEMERKLHRHFANHRLRGEWFLLCDEIVSFIEQHCKPYLMGVRLVGTLPPERTHLNVVTYPLKGSACAFSVAALLALAIGYGKMFGLVDAPTANIVAIPMFIFTGLSVALLAVWGCQLGMAELRSYRSLYRYHKAMKALKS